jgi:hypothetical protein
MTTWELVDEGEGVVVHISDKGRKAYADDRARLATDQRIDSVVGVHTAILIGASIGLVVTFGALVVTKILGA